MPPGDAFRALADDLKERAQRGRDPEKRRQLEKLAAEYQRLADKVGYKGRQ